LRRPPFALARSSRTPRIRETAFAILASSTFNGTAYNKSAANPRSAVAVERTRSSEMPLITINGTAIATCNAAVTR
jgi:hypothetical protein